MAIRVGRRSRRTFSSDFEIFRRRVDDVVIYFFNSDFKFFDDATEFSVTSLYVVFITARRNARIAPLLVLRRNARIASAVLAIRVNSVRLSHAGIVSKRLHAARCSLCCQIAKCV